MAEVRSEGAQVFDSIESYKDVIYGESCPFQ